MMGGEAISQKGFWTGSYGTYRASPRLLGRVSTPQRFLSARFRSEDCQGPIRDSGRDSGKEVDEALLPHLSPLGWEHINLTGDYIWQQSRQVEPGKFRPLRALKES